MATAELIRAYLEWQADMGSDEVLLPHPLVKRPAAPSAAASGVAERQTPVSATPAGPSFASQGVSQGAAQGAALSPSPSPFPPASREDTAAGLYQSLTQALEKSADSRRGDMSLPGTAARAAGLKSAEALNLPAFSGLDAFWTHLESQPRLLQGELPGSAGAEAGAPAGRMLRGTGPVKAVLALVGFEPGESDIAEGKPFRGESGALLEKMMKAIRLDMGGLYLTNLIKLPVAGKAWSRREVARILPLLHAELALAEAPMVLLLGQECAQAVLKTGKTLDELRQETHRMEGREFFVTHHPFELLRKEEFKRKAWEDLQWLQRRITEAQARP